MFFDNDKADAAKAALTWVAEKSDNAGYQAVAKLRLAALLADAKAYDEALKQLAGIVQLAMGFGTVVAEEPLMPPAAEYCTMLAEEMLHAPTRAPGAYE